MRKIGKVTKEELNKLTREIVDTPESWDNLNENMAELCRALHGSELDGLLGYAACVKSPLEVCCIAMAIGYELALQRAEISELEELVN
jgi:hypothetical protein